MPSTRAARSTTTPREPILGMPASPMSSDIVARRAYELFLSRGGEHGHDLDDWFSAERELLGGQVSAGN
jgi:hypothetical protein